MLSTAMNMLEILFLLITQYFLCASQWLISSISTGISMMSDENLQCQPERMISLTQYI